MPKQLPRDADTNIMHYLATALLNTSRAGVPDTLARIRAFHPAYADAADDAIAGEAFSPDDARLTIAREHGFATWRQLEAYLDHPGEMADFQQLACLAYFQTDRPANRERALEMLAAQPGLGSSDIWSAACIGDAQAVASFLDADPGLLNQRGGYFDWEPLLYACYSRLTVPGKSTLAVARCLIERGADPNAFYMWGGQYRFTALTGAFGEGEMGPVNQPPHPECDALARLLLDAGAYPNDSQALYNTMFTPGSECLELLLEYGLSDMDRNNWLQQHGEDELIEHPQKTLAYQLGWAVRNHHEERAKLLIDHGADVDAEGADGLTHYEAAMVAGHPELAEYLVDHGAEAVKLTREQRFASACMAADARKARAMLKKRPALVVRTRRADPELLANAASGDRRDAMRVMIEVGFDLNDPNAPPLHQAAFHDHVQMAELLLEGGASVHLRENRFAATPFQWAVTAGSEAVRELLAKQELGLFDSVLCENLPRIDALLDARPELLETTIGAERDPAKPHNEDWQTPLAFAVLRNRPAAVERLIARGADIDVLNGEGDSLLDLAYERSTDDIVALLEGDSGPAQ